MACNNLIENSIIEDIYRDDNLVVSNTVLSECIDDNIKKAYVRIYDENDNDMLERPIERIY